MLDLFDTPLLPGLRSMDAFVSRQDAPVLIAAIDDAPLSPFRFQGWLGKRLTHSFGWHYDFDTGAFAAVAPIPDWLEPLRARAEDFAGLTRGSLVQALVIRYDIGAGIGWHRDRPHFEHVVGISLGSLAIMRFRRRIGARFERVNLPLVPCGAYHLSGEARHDWEHSIAEMSEPRWSITFRSLSDTGRALFAAATALGVNRR
ncbi:2OG-Fe(II) oxygenase [Sphingomonas sp. Leaf357]|uniref:alpha-ketoglutarate-dependent dioxygenase AlkB n=1 Tax=Sphingomonas sp. Leaf357 TaxID=1736350 RepID=UPI0006F63D6D|nr:alpha-ketoglutarate-dependent dioxygenase AlkB [Sphingomonas sp. Leaf357]KQS03755.1 2OG-Fe(II) oxygenase [Sphingomonas sp. Leaf357]